MRTYTVMSFYQCLYFKAASEKAVIDKLSSQGFERIDIKIPLSKGEKTYHLL